MWLFFFPQFLVDGRDSQEVKGMILSLYLIVAEILVHVVSFISLGMLREKKGQTFNCFFFFFFSCWIFSFYLLSQVQHIHTRDHVSREIPIPDGIYRTSIVFRDLVPCEPMVRALLVRSWLFIALHIDVMYLSSEILQSIFH